MSLGTSRFVLVPYEIYYNSKLNIFNQEDQPASEENFSTKKDPPITSIGTQAKLLAIQSRFENKPSNQVQPDSLSNYLTRPSEDVDLISASLIASLSGGKVEKCRQILEAIKRSQQIDIVRGSGLITINGIETNVNVNQLLYDVQQPNKNLPEDYEPILSLLRLPEFLVTNSKAKEWSNEKQQARGSIKRKWIPAD